MGINFDKAITPGSCLEISGVISRHGFAACADRARVRIVKNGHYLTTAGSLIKEYYLVTFYSNSVAFGHSVLVDMNGELRSADKHPPIRKY